MFGDHSDQRKPLHFRPIGSTYAIRKPGSSNTTTSATQSNASHFFRFRIYRFWVVGRQNIEPWLESRVLKETITLWPKTCIAAVHVVPC